MLASFRKLISKQALNQSVRKFQSNQTQTFKNLGSNQNRDSNSWGYIVAGSALGAFVVPNLDEAKKTDLIPKLSAASIESNVVAKASPESEDSEVDPVKINALINEKKYFKSRKFNFVADVIENLPPALVHIEVEEYNDLYGRPATGTGSGFIVDSSGIIITNAHVVDNKHPIKIRLQNGNVYHGKVEYIDKRVDLATVRINCRNLPTLKFGQSSKLRLGEFVIAMGSPKNMSNTISTGIISLVKRDGKELGIVTGAHFIQTDAALDKGNSGGPLINLNGQVIAVNVLKHSQGISFAIPSDVVIDFLSRCEQETERKKLALSQKAGLAVDPEPASASEHI